MTPPKPRLQLPWTTEKVFAGNIDADVLASELAYGNSDLIRVLKIANVAGPFKAVSPWELEDTDGTVRINAGGYSALPFGDRYPALVDFVQRYLRDGSSMGLPQQATSEWRAALEHNLVFSLASFAPSHADSNVFFSNSGAEAIETAIKFAMAYRPEAPYFINFKRSYHGKTLGALSLTPNREYQDLFHPLALNTKTLPFGDTDAFELAVKQLGADKIAAVFLEPIQGEAGVIIPPDGYLRRMDELCKRHGILVVADEIQTGLGRSGYWFASVEWGGMDPDIICLAKALGGGLTAVGATIARRDIFRNMLGGMASKRHSNTFGGNALAMAVGLKSLEIICQEDLVSRSQELGKRGAKRLRQLAERFPKVFADVRAFGMLFAAELQPVLPEKTNFAQSELVGELTGLLGLLMWHRVGVHGNLSLNSRHTIRLTPALTIPVPLFDQLFDRIDNACIDQHAAWKMLTHTPPRTLFGFAKFLKSV